tara:strand:- start:427 stop:732 length:306 start_codon:yes stop_codon:yes gene_type:complete
MKKSVRKELLEHINNFNTDDQNHFTMFNEDYYIIGYHNATQWLKLHNIGEREGVMICNIREYKEFGEIQTTFEDNEKLVNHLVYWFGLDLCNELDIPFDRE